MARDLTEFNLVYNQAVDSAKALPEAQFKTIASILIVIGWLVTATTAQQFVRANGSVAVPGVALALAMLVAFKAVWIHQHYKRSEALYQQLLRLVAKQDISPEVIVLLKPHPLVPLTFFAVNLVACLSCVVVVWLVAL